MATTAEEQRKEEERKRDAQAVLDANPFLMGVDVNDPEYRGPNGITYASIGPKMPKAAGEQINEIQDDRLVERKQNEDDAIAREGEGVVNILAHKGEGFQKQTAEEQIRSRGQKKGEELEQQEKPMRDAQAKRHEETERQREEARKRASEPQGGR